MNRPGIGNNSNNFWNSGNLNSGNVNINNVGGWGGGWNGGGWNGGDWGYPGWGGHGWNHGYVNPHYGSWYNGCWNNGWNNGWGGWWGGFATGAATWGLASALTNWGVGYGALGYAGGAYLNPYYSAIPATVSAASPYDYSQPIVVNNFIPAEESVAAGSTPAPAPSDTTVDVALEKFKSGDFIGALSGFDAALKAAPNDSVIHEVRALTLFALGRYPEAAATLNAVLASAPGMDWTTVSNLYSSVDVYTAQLRKLEDFCRSNPGDAAGHFVLAYHYLVAGHSDAAAAALDVVVAKQPGDLVAKRMLAALRPAAEATSTAPAATSPAPTESAPETDLVGVWQAGSGKDAIRLEITADSKFTWKASPEGKPAVDLSGTIDTSADAIALHSEKAGTMVGRVASKGPDAFEFSFPGAPADAKPLLFQRQK